MGKDESEDNANVNDEWPFQHFPFINEHVASDIAQVE